jgi:acetoin utilization deacetylase AcuC-like enzyme
MEKKVKGVTKKVLLWNEALVPPPMQTYSPSWRKPGLFLRKVKDVLPDYRIELRKSEALLPEELMEVHDPEYVRGVMAGTESNGFGNRDVLAAKSFLYTTGAMAQGVDIALDTGASVCAPVSGFHHAEYDGGGGFCTFNGLAVAANRALKRGMRPGVIDIDAHYGNGTDSIMRKKNWKFPHYTFGGMNYAKTARLQGITEGEVFLRDLARVLKGFELCDVILYQAGADPHIHDPLGGHLTTMQMMERDKVIFDFFKKRHIPVVWNLAGGYQEPVNKVLDLHFNTLRIWAHA